MGISDSGLMDKKPLNTCKKTEIGDVSLEIRGGNSSIHFSRLEMSENFSFSIPAARFLS